jgi:hypothetical protein
MSLVMNAGRLVCVATLVAFAACGDGGDGAGGDDDDTMTDGPPAGGDSAATADATPDGMGMSSLGIYQSGTRIKMRVGSTADGAKKFNGWFDDEFGTNCLFRPAADGKTRCLPDTSVGIADSVYADAACTMPVAVSNSLFVSCPSDPAPVYALGSVMGTCPNAYRVFEVGSEVTVVYQGSPCAAVSPPGSIKFYVLGPEVAASDFVEMTETVE